MRSFNLFAGEAHVIESFPAPGVIPGPAPGPQPGPGPAPFLIRSPAAAWPWPDGISPADWPCSSAIDRKHGVSRIGRVTTKPRGGRAAGHFFDPIIPKGTVSHEESHFCVCHRGCDGFAFAPRLLLPLAFTVCLTLWLTLTIRLVVLWYSFTPRHGAAHARASKLLSRIRSWASAGLRWTWTILSRARPAGRASLWSKCGRGLTSWAVWSVPRWIRSRLPYRLQTVLDPEHLPSPGYRSRPFKPWHPERLNTHRTPIGPTAALVARPGVVPARRFRRIDSTYLRVLRSAWRPFARR